MTITPCVHAAYTTCKLLSYMMDTGAAHTRAVVMTATRFDTPCTRMSDDAAHDTYTSPFNVLIENERIIEHSGEVEESMSVVYDDDAVLMFMSNVVLVLM